MEVKNLLEFTYFMILLEEIEVEYEKENYIKSADLSNKLIKKLSPYTNMDSEKKEVLTYKKSSDKMIIKESRI